MDAIQRAEYTKFSMDFINEVESWIQKEIYPKFKLSGGKKLDWSEKRTHSRGGMYADGPGISIGMYWCTRTYAEGEIQRVFEYASFDKDRFIGGIYTRDKYDKLRLTILHEIAHALQYYSYRVNSFRCKPHGTVWKNFYLRLRNQFLNPYLEDQIELRNEYEKIKEQINSGKFKLITDDEISKLIKRAASK